MSDIVLRNVAPPKDDDILCVDIYSDGKARCYSWSEKWIDAEVIDSKPQTNADRIRQMSDEELAETMSEKLSEDCLMCPVMKADCPVWESKDVECKTAMLNWLKAPVKAEEGKADDREVNS